MLNNLESLHQFAPTDTILLGVSGGIDSVVLADLLESAGLAFAVAHCNFNLRGEESDRDQTFVQQLAARYDKPFFSKSFDTKAMAAERGISVEMAARELRYAWFEEIRRAHHFDWIAVAHHRDDQLETFFLNLTRGTGLSGLTGMKAVQGRIVRPLLFATRPEIEAYAFERRLEYREDNSNRQTVFLRNKIRHQVLPLMEALNPSFREGLQGTMEHLQDAYSIFREAVERAKERVVRRKSADVTELLIPELKLLNPLSTYLYEMLRPFHFNGEVVGEIVSGLDGQPGKAYFSPTHRAVLDRDVLLVQKLAEPSADRFYLDEACTELRSPFRLTLTPQTRGAGFLLSTSQKMAMIDRDKLQYPLILRRWQKGDYFQPLGMKGMKKLSDFFVDEKFSLPEKEHTWLLTNGEEIVWIVGVRLDDRYKITPATTNILVLSLG